VSLTKLYCDDKIVSYHFITWLLWYSIYITMWFTILWHIIYMVQGGRWRPPPVRNARGGGVPVWGSASRLRRSTQDAMQRHQFPPHCRRATFLICWNTHIGPNAGSQFRSTSRSHVRSADAMVRTVTPRPCIRFTCPRNSLEAVLNFRLPQSSICGLASHTHHHRGGKNTCWGDGGGSTCHLGPYITIWFISSMMIITIGNRDCTIKNDVIYRIWEIRI